MKALVIIPAYNEEKSIKKVVNEIKNTKIKNVILDYIVINDGSKDKTLKVCHDNDIDVIDLPFNLGIGGAVQTGYKYAYYNDYDIAIQFDGDGQHDSSYIKNLISKIDEGYNVVIGSRYVEKLSKFQSTKMRRLGSKILSAEIKLLTRRKICDPTSGFRAVDKNVIEEFSKNYPSDYPEPDTIVSILKKGYKVSEIPVEMRERKNGKSSINVIDSMYYMLKVSLAIFVSCFSTKKGSN